MQIKADNSPVKVMKPKYNFFGRRSMSDRKFRIVILVIVLLTLYASFRIALHRVRKTESAIDRGSNYLLVRQYEDSLREFDKAISINARKNIAWSGKGLSLIGLGRYSEALDNYEKMIRRYPSSTQAWHGKGMSLERLGRYKEALESYDHALRFTPNYQPSILQRDKLKAKMITAR